MVTGPRDPREEGEAPEPQESSERCEAEADSTPELEEEGAVYLESSSQGV